MAQPNKEELREAFKKADEAGTGKLNFSQLKSLMLTMATEEQKKEGDVDQIADLIMKMADINGDKLIDYQELVKFIYDNESDPQEKMREAFRLCDTDRDGYISKKELAEFLKLAGGDKEETGEESKQKIAVMMALFDQDGDDKLSYQEFSDMME